VNWSVNPPATCFVTYVLGCHPAARGCSHGVEVSATLSCPCGVGEKSCPVLRGIDEVGNATVCVKQGEDDAEKAIHGGERQEVGTCAGVAWTHDDHAEESVSHIGAVEEAETVSATTDGDAVAIVVVGACHGARGFDCASHGVLYPPLAFLVVPSRVFPAPIFPSVLRAASVLPPAVGCALPSL